jgi:hypothetical protein
MGDKPEKDPGAWDTCTWSGARRDVLELGARLSFREKIVWLEEGARLAPAFKAAREQQKPNPPDPHS